MGPKSAKNSHFGPKKPSIRPEIVQNIYLGVFYGFLKIGPKILKIRLFLARKGHLLTRRRTRNGYPNFARKSHQGSRKCFN